MQLDVAAAVHDAVIGGHPDIGIFDNDIFGRWRAGRLGVRLGRQDVLHQLVERTEVELTVEVRELHHRLDEMEAFDAGQGLAATEQVQTVVNVETVDAQFGVGFVTDINGAGGMG